MPALAAWSLLGACGATPVAPTRTVYDLLALFEEARVLYERKSIDVGTPGLRGQLPVGWSWNERAIDGTTFAWSRGPSSHLVFFLAAPREITLRLRALADRSVPSPVADVLLNDVPLVKLAMARQWQEYEITLPKEMLRLGINRLVFRYHSATARGGRRPARTAAFDFLEFDGLRGSPAHLDTHRQLLVLPGGAQVEYFLDLPAHSELRLERLSFHGPSASQLIVEVARDGLPTETLLRLDSNRDEVRLTLGERGLAGIRLRALGRSGASHGGRVELAAAVIAPAAETTPDLEPATHETTPDRPDIILYVVDTLRADHLDLDAGGASPTPRLAAFAAEAITCTSSLAQAPWTLPAMASIVTGLAPPLHAAVAKDDRLADSKETLAEILHAAGYRTAAVVANGYVSQNFGFGQGFEHFEFIRAPTARAPRVHEAALQWLDGIDENESFFLYLHTIDPHAPYNPPLAFRGGLAVEPSNDAIGSRQRMRDLRLRRVEADAAETETIKALYAGEVAYTDSAFGDFLDALRRRGLYERALFVFTSDHGEEFLEHGSWTHGQSLHAELVDVPLILRLPRDQLAGSRVEEPVQHVDILPTILAYVGLERPPQLSGRSLIVQSASEEPGIALAAPRRPVHVVSYRNNREISVVRSDWKLIADPQAPFQGRLFRRSRDPSETEDLAPYHPVTAGFLGTLARRELLAQRAARTTPEPAVVDAATEESLRALGYLD